MIDGVLVGVGATLVMDGMAELTRRGWGVEPLDYRLVGRWLLHMRRGVFSHPAIAEAEVAGYERVTGWGAHYAIGAGVGLTLTSTQPAWLRHPTPLPALVTGLLASLPSLLVMHPAFGLGVAASATEHPTTIRLRVLQTHLVFGAGLFLSARTVALIRPR